QEKRSDSLEMSLQCTVPLPRIVCENRLVGSEKYARAAGDSPRSKTKGEARQEAAYAATKAADGTVRNEQRQLHVGLSVESLKELHLKVHQPVTDAAPPLDTVATAVSVPSPRTSTNDSSHAMRVSKSRGPAKAAASAKAPHRTPNARRKLRPASAKPRLQKGETGGQRDDTPFFSSDAMLAASLSVPSLSSTMLALSGSPRYDKPVPVYPSLSHVPALPAECTEKPAKGSSADLRAASPRGDAKFSATSVGIWQPVPPGRNPHPCSQRPKPANPPTPRLCHAPSPVQPASSTMPAVGLPGGRLASAGQAQCSAAVDTSVESDRTAPVPPPPLCPVPRLQLPASSPLPAMPSPPERNRAAAPQPPSGAGSPVSSATSIASASGCRDSALLSSSAAIQPPRKPPNSQRRLRPASAAPRLQAGDSAANSCCGGPKEATTRPTAIRSFRSCGSVCRTVAKAEVWGGHGRRWKLLAEAAESALEESSSLLHAPVERSTEAPKPPSRPRARGTCRSTCPVTPRPEADTSTTAMSAPEASLARSELWLATALGVPVLALRRSQDAGKLSHEEMLDLFDRFAQGIRAAELEEPPPSSLCTSPKPRPSADAAMRDITLQQFTVVMRQFNVLEQELAAHLHCLAGGGGDEPRGQGASFLKFAQLVGTLRHGPAACAANLVFDLYNISRSGQLSSAECMWLIQASPNPPAQKDLTHMLNAIFGALSSRSEEGHCRGNLTRTEFVDGLCKTPLMLDFFNRWFEPPVLLRPHETSVGLSRMVLKDSQHPISPWDINILQIMSNPTNHTDAASPVETWASMHFECLDIDDPYLTSSGCI
ncbi:hypothetical protein CYMTET_46900, partial [Cymbomonas tetramitiformis]